MGPASSGFKTLDLPASIFTKHEAYLEKWLQAGYHGTMDWDGTVMVASAAAPSELVPGTCTVISCRMDYLPEAADAWEILENSEKRVRFSLRTGA